jgi:two-component system LytT family response regulator
MPTAEAPSPFGAAAARQREPGERVGTVTTTRFLPRLVVRQVDRLIVLRIEEVDWFEAEGNHVLVHVGSERHVYRYPLGALGNRLDPARFARAHRSAIVNLDAVREVDFLAVGGCELVLRGGERIAVSRRCRHFLLKQVGMV